MYGNWISDPEAGSKTEAQTLSLRVWDLSYIPVFRWNSFTRHSEQLHILGDAVTGCSKFVCSVLNFHETKNETRQAHGLLFIPAALSEVKETPSLRLKVYLKCN